MRVLIVSPYVPHQDAGHGTGAFMDGVLRRMADRHEVTLATFYDDSEQRFLDDLRSRRIRVHGVYRARGKRSSFLGNVGLIAERGFDLVRSVSTWTPYYASKWRRNAMRRLVKDLTKSGQFDIVQFELTFMAGYAPAVQTGKIILHEHDVAYRPAYRRFRRAVGPVKLIRYFDLCMWTRYELQAVSHADGTLAVTEQDRMLLSRLTGAGNITYLPRAVEIPPRETPPRRDAGTVLFVGSFAHAPNIDAALEIVRSIAPEVWRKFPDTRFVFAGPNPPDALEEAAQHERNIAVLGFVKDLDSLLHRSTMFLAPLRFGGGVKVKLLHAMAHGLPVVTTPLGAEGIEGAVPGASLLMGRTPAELSDAVCRLLRDPAYAAIIGDAGLAAMKRYYSWDRVISTIEECYRTTLQQRKV